MTREEVYACVRQIPRGRVASYGDVARAAGYPNHARQVGYALSALPGGSDVPWQRVVNARGEVSPRPNAERQRALLEDEGVEFDARGRIDWSRFGWE
ncbi:MAG TPA: methyltransferase [Planctomycetes bacterium]|nr:methyltransferase [Planctomycetota bacterium]